MRCTMPSMQALISCTRPPISFTHSNASLTTLLIDFAPSRNTRANPQATQALIWGFKILITIFGTKKTAGPRGLNVTGLSEVNKCLQCSPQYCWEMPPVKLHRLTAIVTCRITVARVQCLKVARTHVIKEVTTGPPGWATTPSYKN